MDPWKGVSILVGVYVLWAIFTISTIDPMKTLPRLRRLIVGHTRSKVVAYCLVAATVIYCLYALRNEADEEKRNKLKTALKAALVAFGAALGGRLDLLVAPFFFTLILYLHPSLS